jgi:SAM-dependent methyltransferase
MREVFEFWDRETANPVLQSWMANADVRRYINRSTSGDDHASALDYFQPLLTRPGGRALSIGCGTGAFERELVRRGVVAAVDAFDGSLLSLAAARRAAAEAGYASQLRYFAADFDALVLREGAYDLVVAHQSLHHVTELERLYATIMTALKPDGMLYFDEYVGPSRFDWNDRVIAPQRAVYTLLPAHVRRHEKLLLPIQQDDPSEAARSSEILRLLGIGFDVVERKDYGGNLLSVLFPAIDWSRADENLARELIERERALLGAGASAFHTVVLARPKRGAAREAALRQYARAGWRSRIGRRVMPAVRTARGLTKRVGPALMRRLRALVVRFRRSVAPAQIDGRST